MKPFQGFGQRPLQLRKVLVCVKRHDQTIPYEVQYRRSSSGTGTLLQIVSIRRRNRLTQRTIPALLQRSGGSYSGSSDPAA